MKELNSTRLLQEISTKLPLESGVNSKPILSTMLGSEEITVCRVDGLVVERTDQ